MTSAVVLAGQIFLVILIASYWEVAQAQDGNPDYHTDDLGVTGRGVSTLIVCVSPWAPFVFYNSSNGIVSGYEWEIFQMVARALDLSYRTRVMGWGQMMNSLRRAADDPERCDLAPSSIPVTPDLMPTLPTASSPRFSFPTFHSGYAIFTPIIPTQSDRWSFGRVFTPQLWAVLLVSSLVLATLAYIAERDYAKRGLGKTKYPTAFRPGMYEAVYNTTGKLFNVVQDLKVTSLAGKLISMGWGFLVLVASTTYTAGVTASLTSLNFQTTINSVADLQMYDVITWDAIVKNFLKYGFIPRGLPWLTEADGLAMLKDVADGKADAGVLDYPWVKYQLSSRCDLAIAAKEFHYIDNSVGYNPNLPLSFMKAYDNQLVFLQQNGTFEALQNSVFLQSACPQQEGSNVVTFNQMEGLWIILAGFVGLALLAYGLPHVFPALDPDIKRSKSLFRFKSMGASMVNMVRRSFNRDSLPKTDRRCNTEDEQSVRVSHADVDEAVATAAARPRPSPCNKIAPEPSNLNSASAWAAPRAATSVEPSAPAAIATALHTEDNDAVIPFRPSPSPNIHLPTDGEHLDHVNHGTLVDMTICLDTAVSLDTTAGSPRTPRTPRTGSQTAGASK